MVTSRLWVMSVASAVALIFWTPNGVAQETPIQPSTAPEPRGHDPFARITPATAERHKPTGRLPAPIPATAPDPMAFPELGGRTKRVATQPPPVRASPSILQLIEIVRRRPGGAQLIERARRSGATIPSTSSLNDAPPTIGIAGGPSASSATLDRFTSVFAPITATVTRPANDVTVAGVGRLTAQALYPFYATNDPAVWGPLDRISYGACPVGGSCEARSWVSIYLNAQSTGWYLINVQATPIAAEMRMYSSTAPAGYNVVTSFPYPTTAGYSSYPVLLYLAAGTHRLAWVNRDFFAWVSEVSATKL